MAACDTVLNKDIQNAQPKKRCIYTKHHKPCQSRMLLNVFQDLFGAASAFLWLRQWLRLRLWWILRAFWLMRKNIIFFELLPGNLRDRFFLKAKYAHNITISKGRWPLRGGTLKKERARVRADLCSTSHNQSTLVFITSLLLTLLSFLKSIYPAQTPRLKLVSLPSAKPNNNIFSNKHCNVMTKIAKCILRCLDAVSCAEVCMWTCLASCVVCTVWTISVLYMWSVRWTMFPWVVFLLVLYVMCVLALSFCSHLPWA